MSILNRILILFVIVVLSYSCAFHRGVMTSIGDMKNVKYVDFAFGSAKTKHIFGIGGLNHDALVFEAKLHLMKNFPLKAGEYYTNFIVDFKETFLLIQHTTLVTITADIVRPINDNTETPFSDIVKQKLILTKKNDFFSVGDTVVDVDNYRYIVSTNNSVDKILVWPIDANRENFQFSKLSKQSSDIFSLKKTINNYVQGDDFNNGFNIYKIIGINETNLLLWNQLNNEYKVVQQEKKHNNN